MSCSELNLELLETIHQQEQIITRQQNIIAKLTNENAEQENMINTLMKENCSN